MHTAGCSGDCFCATPIEPYLASEPPRPVSRLCGAQQLASPDSTASHPIADGPAPTVRYNCTLHCYLVAFNDPYPSSPAHPLARTMHVSGRAYPASHSTRGRTRQTPLRFPAQVESCNVRVLRRFGMRPVVTPFEGGRGDPRGTGLLRRREEGRLYVVVVRATPHAQAIGAGRSGAQASAYSAASSSAAASACCTADSILSNSPHSRFPSATSSRDSRRSALQPRALGSPARRSTIGGA